MNRHMWVETILFPVSMFYKFEQSFWNMQEKLRDTENKTKQLEVYVSMKFSFQPLTFHTFTRSLSWTIAMKILESATNFQLSTKDCALLKDLIVKLTANDENSNEFILLHSEGNHKKLFNFWAFVHIQFLRLGPSLWCIKIIFICLAEFKLEELLMKMVTKRRLCNNW